MMLRECVFTSHGHESVEWMKNWRGCQGEMEEMELERTSRVGVEATVEEVGFRKCVIPHTTHGANIESG